MAMDDEWLRLQGLYAAMSDDELVRLAGKKAGLTEVAQQAVETEMNARGLTIASEESAAAMPEPSGAQDDPALVELTTFQIAMDAETALRELDECGVPVRMEPAMRRLVEGGPLVKTNWLTIYVERTRQQEAVEVLRKKMGLFPVLDADEMDDSADEDGEDSLAIVGSFEAADAEVALKALTDAGIWFEAERDDESGGTMIMGRPEDLERALEAVEEAFEEG